MIERVSHVPKADQPGFSTEQWLQLFQEGIYTDITERIGEGMGWIQGVQSASSEADAMWQQIPKTEAGVTRGVLQAAYKQSEGTYSYQGFVKKGIQATAKADLAASMSQEPVVTIGGHFRYIPRDIYRDIFVEQEGRPGKASFDRATADPALGILRTMDGNQVGRPEPDPEYARPLTAADRQQLVELMPLMLTNAVYKMARWDTTPAALVSTLKLLERIMAVDHAVAQGVDLVPTRDYLCLAEAAALLDRQRTIQPAHARNQAKQAAPLHREAFKLLATAMGQQQMRRQATPQS